MDPRDRERLQRNYAKLLDVSYSSISPHLISTFVLTLEMHEEIESKPTERKKMEKLISILPSRGNNALDELIKALRPSYGWIALQLEDGINNNINVRPASSTQNHRRRNLPDLRIDSHIGEISRILYKHTRVLTHWKFLARAMNLPAARVLDIHREMAYSGGYEYAVVSILEDWATHAGSGATISKLVIYLKRDGMNSCAEDVVGYWETFREYHEDEDQHHHQIRRGRSPVMTDV